MIIKLSKDCRIEASDGLQFTLQVRERVSSKGVGGKVSSRVGELTDWKNKGYYGTISQAMKAVLKRSILTKRDEVDAKELAAYLEKVTRRIENACEGLVKASSAAQLVGVVEADTLDELFGMGE